MNKEKSFSFCLIVLFVIAPYTSVAQKKGAEGFLRKGTLANDPNDELRIILYVPKYTLLYDIGKKTYIPSRKRRQPVPYKLVTTQDGIRVLVREKDIRYDFETLKRYDFLINRMTPYCETEEACNGIWEEFPRFTEGDDWDSAWPSVTGKVLNDNRPDVKEVTLSISGKDVKAFFPKHYKDLPLEDYGFLTYLNRSYPTYRFSKKEIKSLRSECGHEKLSSSKNETYTRIEAYAKASVSASVDVSDALSKAIPKSVAKSILSFLGISANISADAFVDGDWKKETTDATTESISYGDKNEHWTVDSIWIERRLGDGKEGYEPYGSMLMRKVYSCRANQQIEMNFASILLTEFPKNNDVPAFPQPPIILDTEVISKAKLPNDVNDRALLSINTQSSHHRAVDFFKEYGVQKSIATFIIKELNRGKPR